MSFDDEMRLHYLTVSYEESWECVHDAVKFWLDASSPMFDEKREEIAWKCWVANGGRSLWARASWAQMVNHGLNHALMCEQSYASRHPLWNTLLATSGNVPERMRAARDTLENTYMAPDLRKAYDTSFDVLCRKYVESSPADAYAEIYSAITALCDAPISPLRNALAGLLEAALKEDGVDVRFF